MAVDLTPSLTWSAKGRNKKGSEPAQGMDLPQLNSDLMVWFLAGSVKP
jgi:hypothetical protein